MSADQPVLFVVIDTEEEFDWSAPFSRANTATTSMAAQARAQDIFDDVGLAPTYAVDYPVAGDDKAVGYLNGLVKSGRASLGAHLHPWVTPPHEEAVSARNSYHCNLPADLEREKIRTLTQSLGERFGPRPTIFKSGRYGLGPSTVRSIIECGYRVDCSVVPYTDFSAQEGPSFLGFPNEPYWLDEAAGLLEAPLTTGFMGWGARLGPALQGLFDRPLLQSLRVPGVMSRSGFLDRGRLTPEGFSAADQRRLLKALVDQGRRTFSLTYHSPSLAPGHTPYVRSESDLKVFLASLREVLTFFRDDLGGVFTTLDEVHRHHAERNAVPAVKAGTADEPSFSPS